MQTMKTASSTVQTGILGLFDILGYQSFLENNDSVKAAALVVDRIVDAEETVIKYVRETAGSDDQEAILFVRYIERVAWAAFSDTIILMNPIEPGGDLTDNIRSWHALILSAQILCKYMFEQGLPLRGAITYGNYVSRKTCFAGRAILDAYKLANELEFAGSVMTEQAFQELQRITEHSASDQTVRLLLDVSLLRYQVPREKVNEPLRTLNFLAVKGTSSRRWRGVLYQIVLDSFRKHRKSISDREIQKAKNTAAYLEFLCERFPGIVEIEEQK